jgi:hypothetical protein
MKPYVVEFTFRTVVMGEDEIRAYGVARDQFRDIVRDETPDIWVEGEVRSEDDLPEGWDLMCLPYGGDGNTRLSEILAPVSAAQAVTDQAKDKP